MTTASGSVVALPEVEAGGGGAGSLIDLFDRVTASGAAGSTLRGLDGWYGNGGHCNGSGFVMDGAVQVSLAVADQSLPFECLVNATIFTGGTLYLQATAAAPYVELDVYESGGQIEVDLFDGGSAFTSAYVAAVGVPISIRFRYDADTMMAKVWPSSGAEPGSWTVSATDTGYLSGLAPYAELHLGNWGSLPPTSNVVTRFEVTAGWPNTSLTFAYGTPVTFDDFNRSVAANGWGAPSGNPSNPWAATAQNYGSYSYSVDGSQGVANSTTGSYGLGTNIQFASLVPSGQFIRAADGVRITGTFTVSATNLGSLSIGYAAPDWGSASTFFQVGGYFMGPWPTSSTYNYKAEAVWGWRRRWKFWKVGDPEPDWQFVSPCGTSIADAGYLTVTTQGTYMGPTTTLNMGFDDIATTPITLGSTPGGEPPEVVTEMVIVTGSAE